MLLDFGTIKKLNSTELEYQTQIPLSLKTFFLMIFIVKHFFDDIHYEAWFWTFFLIFLGKLGLNFQDFVLLNNDFHESFQQYHTIRLAVHNSLQIHWSHRVNGPLKEKSWQILWKLLPFVFLSIDEMQNGISMNFCSKFTFHNYSRFFKLVWSLCCNFGDFFTQFMQCPSWLINLLTDTYCTEYLRLQSIVCQRIEGKWGIWAFQWFPFIFLTAYNEQDLFWLKANALFFSTFLWC